MDLVSSRLSYRLKLCYRVSSHLESDSHSLHFSALGLTDAIDDA